ncbi:MAG: ATP-binding protein [Candidatus Woesearchaeota archaeon]
MISTKDLQEIINSTKILNSIPRNKYLKEIKPWLNKKEIIIIKGIRRCGKTHIMHQLIKTLPKKNVFYINFDDFRFDKYLQIELLEKIINLRNKTKPSYFFLDEIQRIKGFEKWLRTYYDREENIKFIIGGSNISLLTPKLSTVLTGRNITFEIYPLDYKEFQTFSKGPIETYLKFGGFPEVVLAEDETTKRRRLEQYINDIVTKDILEKYELSNATQLKALIKFFLNNPGVKISANKLGKQLSIHKDTAQKYIEYIKDTFLIFEVPYFSYSAKTKYIGSQAPKYYCIDNGLHTITTTKENKGILLENAVAIKLQQTNKELFYWQDIVEIDFVADNKAIQVTATKNIPQRELNAFTEFKKKHKTITKRILISEEKEGKKENVQFIKTENFLKQK